MAGIIISSQTGRATGFGHIACGIANALAREHTVDVIGVGPAHASEAWTGHPHSELDPTRRSILSIVRQRAAPDVILLLGQGQLQSWQISGLRSEGYAGLIMGYVPIEGAVYNAAPLEGLLRADHLVTYTQASAQVLIDALRSLDTGVSLPHISTIAHAVETGTTLKVESKAALRAALFPGAAHRQEGTWVLNANRNDQRKRPEIALRAFASVAQRHGNATLILHCQSRRRDVDLCIERDRLGLRRQVLITSEFEASPLSADRLTQLYACCEIGINSTLGEGWGLVPCEHALQGGAQVLPGHANLREIWTDAPLWAPVRDAVRLDEVFCGQLPEEGALEQGLRTLLEHPDQASRVANNCYDCINQPAYGWEQVGTQWTQLISTALGTWQ
ncbi:hypothetical protein ACN1C3_23880 [Pseudomonas sp. H11T01]|uniref:hypothetical protein n=1 Tax=Pseudomonas sp. H11T01 TaxID=3402749 RepID=UPI003AD06948